MRVFIFLLLFSFFSLVGALTQKEFDARFEKLQKEEGVNGDILRGDLLFEAGHDPLALYYYLKAEKEAPGLPEVKGRIAKVREALQIANPSTIKSWTKFLATSSYSYGEVKAFFILFFLLALALFGYFSLLHKRVILLPLFLSLVPLFYLGLSLMVYIYFMPIQAVVLAPHLDPGGKVLPAGSEVSILSVTNDGKVLISSEMLGLFLVEPESVKLLPL